MMANDIHIELTEDPAAFPYSAPCRATRSAQDLRSSCLPGWVAIRVGDSELFGPLPAAAPVEGPRLEVYLLDFTLAFAYVVEETILRGKSELDPWEYGDLLFFRLDGAEIEITSSDTGVVVRVPIEQLLAARRQTNDWVRRALLMADPAFRDHAEFGDWVRGEREFFELEGFEELGRSR